MPNKKKFLIVFVYFWTLIYYLNFDFFKISSFGLFLTYILLLTTNSQFIAFNEFASTGKCPAVYFFIAIILAVVYLGTFIVSAISLWSTADILNKWNQQTKSIFISVNQIFFLLTLTKRTSLFLPCHLV